MKKSNDTPSIPTARVSAPPQTHPSAAAPPIPLVSESFAAVLAKLKQ